MKSRKPKKPRSRDIARGFLLSMLLNRRKVTQSSACDFKLNTRYWLRVLLINYLVFIHYEKVDHLISVMV